MLIHLVPVHNIGLLILTTCIFIISQFAVSQNPLISSICHKTLFPSDCESIIYSDSRSATAKDRIALGDIVIDMTIKNASETAKILFDNCSKNHNAPSQKLMKECHTKILDVIINMCTTKILWRAGDMAEAKNVVSKSFFGVVETCVNGLDKLKNKDLMNYSLSLSHHLHILDNM